MLNMQKQKTFKNDVHFPDLMLDVGPFGATLHSFWPF